MSSIAQSRAHQMFTRAQRSLAGGVSSSFRAAVKPEPLFIDHGEGGYIVDVDGVRYLDCALAWGPLILGHSHPAVVAAVHHQLSRGHMFGAQHELELRVAERLVTAIPCADLVTYACSGTEAMQVALRLARAATGRPKIIKFEGHYHGWGDGVLVSYHAPLVAMGSTAAPKPVPGTAGQSEAALADVLVVPWNDAGALEKMLKRHESQVAAVVMEPVLCNSGVISPTPGYLEAARALTEHHGALLVFDEVITGFRMALGGAQEIYKVIPDLAIYAKAIAAGFPLSVIAGRQEVMELIADGTVAHSGTYNGNPIVLAAADAALNELSRPDVYTHLRGLGTQLAEGARTLLGRRDMPAIVHQAGPVMQILFTTQSTVRDYREFVVCDAARNAALVGALRARGVLILPDGRWYLSTVHTEADIQRSLDAIDASLAILTT
jgi:glutamate-1-semialdehyde 2,1-aminomutase